MSKEGEKTPIKEEEIAETSVENPNPATNTIKTEPIADSLEAKFWKEAFITMEKYPEIKILFYSLLGSAVGTKVIYKYKEGFGSIRKDKETYEKERWMDKTTLENLKKEMMQELINMRISYDAKMESIVSQIIQEVSKAEGKFNTSLDKKIDKAVSDMKAGIMIELEKFKIDQEKQFQLHQKDMEQKLENFVKKAGNPPPLQTFKQSSFIPSSGMATRFVAFFIKQAKKLVK